MDIKYHLMQLILSKLNTKLSLLIDIKCPDFYQRPIS